ncbi:carbohydrate ABC transporter permease [Microbacterium tumbae]
MPAERRGGASDGPHRRRPRLRRGANLGALLFVVPALAVVVFFIVLPLVRLLYLAMTDYDGFTTPTWVGLANFEYLATWPDFRRIVFNTFILLLGIPVWVVGPFIVAVVLYGWRTAGVFRGLFLVPALMPPLVIGLIFRIVLSDQGPANAFLRLIGLDFLAVGWVSEDPWVLVTVVMVILWGLFGMGVLFYSSALSTVPTETIEAAVLDGAHWRHVVWHILRPELIPATRFWSVFLALSTVTAFFSWIFALTRGGPGVASTTVDYSTYQRALVLGEFGVAAAISVVGILVLLVVVAVVQLFRRFGGEKR